MKSHQESRTISKDCFHYPASQATLAVAQPGDTAQNKMASTAWKQNAKQLSDNTEIILHLYKMFQAPLGKISLNFISNMSLKKTQNLQTAISTGDDF